MIGYTGLYELDLEGIAEINTLNFEMSSLNNITNTEGACLIVDIIYDKEEYYLWVFYMEILQIIYLEQILNFIRFIQIVH